MDETHARIAALRAEIAQLQEAQTRFFEQQQLFDSFVRYSPLLVFIRDRHGRFLMANQAYADMLGLSVADMLGRTPYDLLPVATARRFLQQDQDVFAHGECVVREFTEEIAGRIYVFLTTEFPLYDAAGQIYALGGLSTDLSAFRRTEAALREQQALLQAFLEHAPAVISFKDRYGRYVMDNRRHRELLTGNSEQNTIGTVLQNHVPMQYAAPILAHDQTVLQTSQPAIYEDTIPHADGPQTYLTVKFPVFDQQQTVSGIGAVSIDITARKQAENALQLFKMLVEHAAEGVLLLRTDATVHYANATAARMLGSPLNMIIGSPVARFLPDRQYETLLNDITSALQSDTTWKGELLLQRPDGTFWYSQASAFLLHDDDNKLINVVIMFRDVTERRWLEEQLRLTRFALDNASDGVAFLSQEGFHIYVNQAFCDALHYSADELLARRFTDIDPELTAEQWLAIWNTVRNERSRRFEGRHYRRDGSSFPVEISATYLEFQGQAYICAFTRDITERKAYERQIEQLAFSDPLTGLANRRWLYEAGAAALIDARAGSVALIYLDLDRFKAFNDNLGHDAGDALLVQVTARLRQGLNAQGLMARIGGDEFAVLLTNTSTSAAFAVGHRLLELLHQPFEVLGHRVHLSGSIGIAVGPLPGQQFSTMLTHADIAMYRAKRSNRGIEVYEPGGGAPSADRILLEAELRQALLSDGLILHYQPLMDVDAGTLFAVEALVRWPHPQRGMLSPAVFLPLANEIGLAHKLDDWVLRAALSQVSDWAVGGDPRTVTVNLGDSALQQPQFVEYVANLLATYQVPAECLVVEVTEQTALRDIALTTAVLSELRHLGIRIALDDFGTGYASLTHLRELPVDILKIERIFSSGIGRNAKDEAVLRAVLALGEGLELVIVAEGVETEQQLRWLRAAGCRHIQGFLIGRAEPA